MDDDRSRCDAPGKVNTKEPSNNAHEIHLTALGKETTEQSFNRCIFGKVDKIVHVEAKRERVVQLGSSRVQRILDETQVKARIFEGRSEANRNKNGIDFVVPVLQTASKTIKSFEQEPIFMRVSFGITGRRENDGGFLGWEDAVTERILTITLTKRTMLFDRKAHEKTQ
jgi:hypothetical protein